MSEDMEIMRKYFLDVEDNCSEKLIKYNINSEMKNK
jgi:hypothetical protein